MSTREKKEKFKGYLINLIDRTTIHGLPNVIRAKRNIFKLMWFISFSISVAACSYSIFSSIMEYLSSDVVTQINFINQIPSEFPGVTFFNLRNSKAEVNLNDFMISCTFDKKICTEKDLT